MWRLPSVDTWYIGRSHKTGEGGAHDSTCFACDYATDARQQLVPQPRKGVCRENVTARRPNAPQSPPHRLVRRRTSHRSDNTTYLSPSVILAERSWLSPSLPTCPCKFTSICVQVYTVYKRLSNQYFNTISYLSLRYPGTTEIEGRETPVGIDFSDRPNRFSNTLRCIQAR